jgi:DegV family protein with EDD domain
MPYSIGEDEKFYDMGENTDFTAFFKAMRDGVVPKTSALNEYAYIDYFEPVLKNGEDVYYITFSNAMSATFNAMNTAISQLKEKYPEREIRVIDTKTISMGAGFVVYYAALKYVSGATMDELDKYISDLAMHTATYFAVEDLTYLYRGGRVSGITKVFGTLLNIKPILYFNDKGKILNIAKAKGFKKALSIMKGYLLEKGSELDKYKIFIMQADAEETAKTFANEIKDELGNVDVTIQPVGPVIGAHCGPGTIGLIFHADRR